MTHDALIFNLHDLVLLMAAGLYLLLALLLLVTRSATDKTSSYLLALILLVNAAHALDRLLIWSSTLRQVVLEWNPNLLFLGSFSYWLSGPLLYWYVTSVLYRKFHFSRRDVLHLLPALVVSMLFIFHYHLLPAAEKRAAMWDLQLMWTPFIDWIVTSWHLSILAYGSWCLVVVTRYRKLLKQQYSNVEIRERRWLSWIVVGFIAIAGWKLIVHLIGTSIPLNIANILGIAGNYFTFIFVISLVFISIRYIHLFGGVDDVNEEEEAIKPFTDEQVARVSRIMAEQKPYLDHDITIENLAGRVSIPERTLSRILNQHFGQNFFEFINAHRIEEAKRLLSSPSHKDSSIFEIMVESGFTSKSTFNAAFKNYLGQTPSQYRQSL